MFDRIGRSDDETPFVVEWFAKHGIEVWSTQEGQQCFNSHVDKLMNYLRFWQACNVFFILGAMPGETEVFFDMVDVTFHNGAYLVGILPFFCSADSAGISSEIVVLLIYTILPQLDVVQGFSQ